MSFTGAVQTASWKGVKMTQDKYAVVIVTYNREKLLRECIRQVEAQTVPADKIVIVNNASADGTAAYLSRLTVTGKYHIINCTENIGGAGGFAKGLSQTVTYDVDCILFIDDDAMLSPDYMKKLLQARSCHPRYHAFAGSVVTNGKIDTWHRRRLLQPGLFLKNCQESFYKKKTFSCDIASFCGMLVDKQIIMQIGIPYESYFIWNDDVEYSLRIHRYSRFLVIPDAVLNHRTRLNESVKHPRRYEWKDYYAIRNRVWMLIEHGSPLDRIVNFADLFLRVIFRNWLFSILRIDRYDWKYEKDMAKKALKDAGKASEKPWRIVKQDKYPDVGV